MPNDTRTVLKITGKRSYGGMTPPQSPDLNIIEAVWDHLVYVHIEVTSGFKSLQTKSVGGGASLL